MPLDDVDIDRLSDKMKIAVTEGVTAGLDNHIKGLHKDLEARVLTLEKEEVTNKMKTAYVAGFGGAVALAGSWLAKKAGL